MIPDDAPVEGRPHGFLDSVRNLAATVVALAHDRLELASTEFQEEIARLTGILIWALSALLLGVVGLAFLSIAFLLAVEAPRRPLAAAGLALLFLAGAGVAAWIARGILRAKPRVFDASLNELRKDREGLRRRL